MRVDLLVKNGTLVTSNDSSSCDIAVQDGKIVAVGKSSTLPKGDRTIDARRKLVIPGVIDPHVHFREPGLTYKEDFKTGSMAAAAGGVTAVFDMPNVVPPTSTAQRLTEKAEIAGSKSVVDFGIYGVITPENIDEIGDMAQAGAIGFKIFMGPTVGDIAAPDDGGMLDAFGELQQTGLRVAVHAENREIVQHSIALLRKDGREDALAHLESRPNLAEFEAIQRLILFAGQRRNKLHIPHLSTREGAQMIKDAKEQGLDITAETCPHYLLLSSKDVERIGNVTKMNPPIREVEDNQELWDGLRGGYIDMLATDHSPHSKEEKMRAPIWDTIPGWPGIETLVPLMMTQVNRGTISIHTFVKATSENPAKAFGLYPRKGALRVGSDADITVIDPIRESTVRGDQFVSKGKITPFEGWKVKGMPSHTIVRGNVVMEEGKVTTEAFGKLLSPVFD